MKNLCYTRADNSVAIGHPGSVLSAMTGTGGFVRPENVDREIAKHLLKTEEDMAGFRVDWKEWFTSRLPTARDARVRLFIEGVAFGGLTETEALHAIDGKDRPDDCVDCHIIEDTDLPDRYFRSAWEWSD